MAVVAQRQGSRTARCGRFDGGNRLGYLDLHGGQRGDAEAATVPPWGPVRRAVLGGVQRSRALRFAFL